MTMDTDSLAESLRTSIGVLIRRIRQRPAPGDPSWPEMTALSDLDRGGEQTAAELARHEQISPQSMGTIVTSLAHRGLIARLADPEDGRRMILSVTSAGAEVLASKRDARSTLIAAGLEREFSADELELLAQAAPLMDRLGQAL